MQLCLNHKIMTFQAESFTCVRVFVMELRMLALKLRRTFAAAHGTSGKEAAFSELPDVG